jgi:hypothetical protein
MKINRSLIISIAVAALVLIGTLFLPQQASNRKDLRAAQFGLPIPFLEQDQTTYDLPIPRTIRFRDPREHPTDISWSVFWLDFLFLTSVAHLALSITVTTFPKKDEERGD